MPLTKIRLAFLQVGLLVSGRYALGYMAGVYLVTKNASEESVFDSPSLKGLPKNLTNPVKPNNENAIKIAKVSAFPSLLDQMF